MITPPSGGFLVGGETIKVHILYFSTSWCSPCKYVRRQCIPELLRKFPRTEIKEVDAAAEASLARKMNVQAVPTTIVMSRGKEIARRIGAFDAVALASEVRQRTRSRQFRKTDTES